MSILNEEISRIRQLIGINESFTTSSNLRIGSSGDKVKELQNLLGLEQTGNFDTITKDCVEKLQNEKQIRVDGIVGPETIDVLNKLSNWGGCGTQNKEKIKNIETTNNISTQKEEPIDLSKIKVDQSKITGSSWSSCKMWKGKGGISGNSDKVSTSSSSQGFTISYNGPASGLVLAHSGNGKDTIHQLYNILICEINPYLAQGGMKPDIDNITFDTGSDGKNSKLTISVPFIKSNGIYQIDRRGGWMHDPGGAKMATKCQKINKEGKECYGPIKKIATGPFGKITEHFITYQI